jgi:hypothetical protein
MTLKGRLQQIELKLKAKTPGCNLALLVLQHEGEEPLRPTQEQLDWYLKESGQCQSCTGGECFISHDGQNFHNLGNKKP